LETVLYPLYDFACKTLKQKQSISERLEKCQEEISDLKNQIEDLREKARVAEETVLLLYLYIQKESNKTTQQVARYTLENIYKQPNPLDYFKDYLPSPEDSLNGVPTEQHKVPKLSELARAKKNSKK